MKSNPNRNSGINRSHFKHTNKKKVDGRQSGRSAPPSIAKMMKKSRSSFTKKVADPNKGNMNKSANQNKPLTKNEKKAFAELQQFGRNSSRERYENWKSRANKVKATTGSIDARSYSSDRSVKGSKRHGMKPIGKVNLGFSVHYDKAHTLNNLSRLAKLTNLTVQSITTRVALNRGKDAAVKKLKRARHLSKINPSQQVSGDVFDVIANSLATYEGNEGLSTGNRYLTHYAGSYGKADDIKQPNGVIGQHSGKKVNLSEMYEDGTGEYPYATKLHTIVGETGALRSRGSDYIAALKGNHPGHPAVGYMDEWLTFLQYELSQQVFDDTLNKVIQGVTTSEVY